MQDCMDIISDMKDKEALYAPESFEYLILQSGIIEIPKTIIEETWNHADSVNYFGWEEFYTRYLSDATRNSVRLYSKSRLSEYYKTAGNPDKLKNILPEYIRGLINI